MALIDELATWRAAPEDRRLAWARALADTLGDGFVALSDLVGATGLTAVHEVHTGLDWVAIPGGRCSIGLGAGELAPLLRAVGRPCRPMEEYRALLTPSQPAREVRVEPFLCTRVPVPQSHARGGHPWVLIEADHGFGPDRDWPVVVDRAEARELAAGLDARLMSEAEWEYVARGGGQSPWLHGAAAPEGMEAAVDALVEAPLAEHLRDASCGPFGVWGLLVPGWVADGWHDDLQGAPVDGRAWRPEATDGVVRGGTAGGYPWQGDEVLWSHAAVRMRASPKTVAGVHLARRLPAVRLRDGGDVELARTRMRLEPDAFPEQVEGCVRVEVELSADRDGTHSTYLLEGADLVLRAWVPVPGSGVAPPEVHPRRDAVPGGHWGGHSAPGRGGWAPDWRA